MTSGLDENSVLVKGGILVEYSVLMVTRRARSRAALIEEIEDAARAELAEVGAAALSLRSVARRVGLAPSALYRYFDGRDGLLTALIVQAFECLAAAVEGADDPGAPPGERWLAMGRAMRTWAVAHPQDWALVFGSPVPGYAAPATTVPAGTRVGLRLAGVVAGAPTAPTGLPVPPGLAAWLEGIRSPELADLPDGLLALALLAYSHLVGVVSSEVFGHFGADATPAAELFDHELRLSAALLGLDGP